MLNDIHMHIVSGVDDGAWDMDMARILLILARQQGIQNIVATPHSSAFIKQQDLVHDRFLALREYAAQAFPDIGLYLGCEIRCAEDDMPLILEGLDSGRFLSMNHTRYVLTEFRTDTEADEAFACANRLCTHGWIPIIAHIERYGRLFQTPGTIEQLLECGCLIQVNAYSFFDEESAAVIQNARMLAERQWVHFLGSDAHRINFRPPSVKWGLQYLYEHYDHAYVDEIAIGNTEKFLSVKYQIKL